jgi:hypothetical protein
MHCPKQIERGVSGSNKAPAREAFGTTLEKAAIKGLDGTLTREWKAHGLDLVVSIPIQRLA